MIAYKYSAWHHPDLDCSHLHLDGLSELHAVPLASQRILYDPFQFKDPTGETDEANFQELTTSRDNFYSKVVLTPTDNLYVIEEINSDSDPDEPI